MSFRKAKSTIRTRSDEWAVWKEHNQDELASIGLPTSLYAHEENWSDFVENGHLHWHEDPWVFEFTQLTAGQLAALHRFMEREYGRAERCPPLLSWLRVRCGEQSTS